MRILVKDQDKQSKEYIPESINKKGDIVLTNILKLSSCYMKVSSEIHL